MSGTGHEIEVTSPKHKWMGSQLVQPGLLAILVGLVSEEEPLLKGSDDDIVLALKKRSREEEIVVIFAERNNGAPWRIVPTGKLGEPPYRVSEMLTINFFNNVSVFTDQGTQDAYLSEVGMAIDGELVGV